MHNISLFQPKICDEAINSVVETLKSGWIGLGPKTKQFEDDFANYVEAKYCSALNSATSALHLAMKLIDLQPDDEVITTPLTFVSTNHAILYEKGIPVFADIQPDTLNIDPKDIVKKITKKTKAILCVHYGGYPCDMDEIHQIARDYNLVVIEDCAHAAGSSYKGKKIGSISSINCFSFHAVKNLPLADGGAITTNNQFYLERLNKLRWLGIDKSTADRTTDDGKIKGIAYAWKYDVEEVGYKYHMNDITASIGIAQLKLLDEQNQKRREIVKVYREGLKDVNQVEFLNYKDDRITSQHICAVKVENRPELICYLKENGIAPGVHYLRNDEFPMFNKTYLPNVDKVQDKILSLPLHMNLTVEDVYAVIETIKNFYNKT